MNDKNRQLLKLILEKTNAKLISWSKGSSASEFRVELNSATVTILSGVNTMFQCYITVNMYNGTGSAIQLAHETENATINSDYDLLQELYNSAKDSSTKETETIDNLFKELSELEVVEG